MTVNAFQIVVFSLMATWIASGQAGNTANVTTPLNLTSATPSCNIINSTGPCMTEASPTNATIQHGNVTNYSQVETTPSPNATLPNDNFTDSPVTQDTNLTDATVTPTTVVDVNSTTSKSTTKPITTAETTVSTPNTTTQSTTTTASTTVTTTSPTTATEGTTPDTTTNETTAGTRLTITERVKAKWEELVAETNFDNSSLNGTRIAELMSSDVVEVIIDYYKSANQTALKIMLEESRMDELAKMILDEVPSVLEIYVRNRFNSSQNISLYGTFAALNWFHDEVLNKSKRFSSLLATYDPGATPSGSNESKTNETSSDTTSFIRYLLGESTADELFKSICKVAEEEGVNESICPKGTETPPGTTAAPLPGPDKFEATWGSVVKANYDFLTAQQNQELQSVTPGNMTTALIQYVKAMDADEVKKLVDGNVTKYVSSVLRSSGNTALGTLGKEAVDAMGGDVNKEDIFYVYLNFMNNIIAEESKFETILKGYVDVSSSRRRRSSESSCDRSTINADGLCCYVITKEASNLTTLRNSLCEELQGGAKCINSIQDVEETTSEPVPSGLSTGEIVGIALGAFFGLVLIAIIVFLLWKRFGKKKSKVNPQDGNEDSDHNHVEMDGRDTADTAPRAPSRSSTNGQPASRNGS